MTDCPIIIAELDRLTRLVREADRAVYLRIHNKVRGSLRSVQRTRDEREDRLYEFARQHGINACMSQHYRLDPKFAR